MQPMSSDDNKKIITMREYIESTSSALVNELFAFILRQEKKVGKAASDELVYQVLARYVGATAFKSLQEKPKKETYNSKEEMAQLVIKNFAQTKFHCEEAIALGFEKAMEKFSGKEMDYYCKITAVSDRITRKTH